MAEKGDYVARNKHYECGHCGPQDPSHATHGSLPLPLSCHAPGILTAAQTEVGVSVPILD